MSNKYKFFDKNNIPDKVIDSFLEDVSKNFDPDGSWTGVPKDKHEQPIQDADDL